MVCTGPVAVIKTEQGSHSDQPSRKKVSLARNVCPLPCCSCGQIPWLVARAIPDVRFQGLHTRTQAILITQCSRRCNKLYPFAPICMHGCMYVYVFLMPVFRCFCSSMVHETYLLKRHLSLLNHSFPVQLLTKGFQVLPGIPRLRDAVGPERVRRLSRKAQ